MNKLVVAGVTVGMLGGLGAGMVLGVPGLAGAQKVAVVSYTATNDATVDSSITRTRTHAQRLAEILAPLIKDKTITQAQADKVIAAIDAAGPPVGGRNRLGDHSRGPSRGPANFGTIATAIGITVDELRTQLQAGKSIADVAKANDVSVDKVVTALVKAFKTHLDEEVASGELTQAEADAKLADVKTRITKMVNRTILKGGNGA